LALIKRGKKGIIKIWETKEWRKHIKGKRGTYGKNQGQHSKESTIKNLLK
jgi:hypothetical protein